jgi:hypothetical protein
MAASTTDTNNTGILDSFVKTLKVLEKDRAVLWRRLKEAPKPSQPVHTFYKDSVAAPTANNASAQKSAKAVGAVDDMAESTNYCQIIKNDYGISGTMEASEYKGVDDILAHKKMMAMKKQALDIEYAVVNATGNSGTTREMLGMYAWAIANTACTATATSTTFNGTAGEEIFNNVMKAILDNGGNPTDCYCSPLNKHKISQWTGLGATRYVDIGKDKLSVRIAVYESDYGTIELLMGSTGIVGNANVYLYNQRDLKLAWLRRPKSVALPLDTDSTDWRVLAEGTLECDPDGIGAVIIS